MKISELLKRKSECIKLAQSGFTFEEASDANQLIINALNARIAELEGKLIQCPRCGDPITNELGDNPICGACALASELNVKTLQARIAELEAENAIFRNADYESLQCGSRIAELEAENAKLKEALERAAEYITEINDWCPRLTRGIDWCPYADAGCPYMDKIDHQQCWLDWLMDNKQNKGDKDE